MKCEKCGVKNQKGVVIMLVGNIWLCGDCYLDYQEKINKMQRGFILEE